MLCESGRLYFVNQPDEETFDGIFTELTTYLVPVAKQLAGLY
ncbi:hypothetical protein [Staphylococcus warneri]|nr:hypothetical protein [Staphylococcus warneri]